jgi:hypothetical protein
MIQSIEKLVSLPLWKEYKEMIESEIRISEIQAFESI